MCLEMGPPHVSPTWTEQEEDIGDHGGATSVVYHSVPDHLDCRFHNTLGLFQGVEGVCICRVQTKGVITNNFWKLNMNGKKSHLLTYMRVFDLAFGRR